MKNCVCSFCGSDNLIAEINNRSIFDGITTHDRQNRPQVIGVHHSVSLKCLDCNNVDLLNETNNFK